MTRAEALDILHDAKWALVDMDETVCAWAVEDAERMVSEITRGNAHEIREHTRTLRWRTFKCARILPVIEVRTRLFIVAILESVVNVLSV